MAGGTRRRRAAIGLLTALAAVLFGGATADAAATHPLDPLDADELATIATVLKASGRFSDRTNYAWAELREPAKQVVQAFTPGAPFARLAALDAIDYAKGKAFAVVVDVKARAIVSMTDLAGRQPGLTDHDTDLAQDVLDADPRIKAALVARGMAVPGKVSDAVAIQYAPIGHDPALARQGGRLVRAFFSADQKSVNDFSPFIDGLMAVVDLYAGQVIRLDDRAGVPSVPVPHDIFDTKVRGAPAQAPPAPRLRQGGRGFTVERNVVRWQGWRFRYGFNLREGLVLYQLARDDGGRARAVLYRGSVSEIVTAYGDASDLWSWLELFDEGVYGIGASAVEVTPGRDVPANAAVLDAVLPDAAAPRFAMRAPRRVYVYERAAGNLMQYRLGDLAFHAPATELVIGTLASFGNYVYGLNWVLKQDGAFAFEVELAGEVLTKFVQQPACDLCKAIAGGPGPNGESRTYVSHGDDRYGTLVHPNLVAANHQHWFNLRLDFDIDGAANAVMENNLARVDAHGEATDRGFTASHTVFGRAADAARDMDDMTARSWTIYNPAAVNSLGRAAGYTIVPMANAMTVFPRARLQGPGGFTAHQLWVTPYRPEQRYAGGAYPNQSTDDDPDTLARSADDASIYDRDIVVWYSLGMTHFPWPENYPIMSDDRLSVTFRPDGFFVRNPALGLGRVDADGPNVGGPNVKRARPQRGRAP